MKHNVRRAKVGRPWRDRLGHLSEIWDGHVTTWGAGWREWPAPCERCVRIMGRPGTFAMLGTIGHVNRHTGLIILSRDWTGPDFSLETLP